MPSQRYKEHSIDFDENELSIDGEKIIIEIDQSGKFHSSKFPYSSFDSMQDLAKAIIDNM